ncbi:hypothetical protein T265_08706 [Opisthorchis viverrini]|uniref:Uncharacterized protein n=1 Tax=Opisthorchis viverrini TaxID=6198 RepID=A0A074ZCN6_OPIVI|nr:hypothetical protein T265_08706 [Opisthorchis viverrini]KER23382.1 hypothetical protein T265_08706 [Opisthorchis viverrini]
MPPTRSTRAGILPGCPSLDRGSRGAEVGFEPRTLQSAPYRYLAVIRRQGGMRGGILSSLSSLDRSSRDAEVGFEPQIFRCGCMAKFVGITSECQCALKHLDHTSHLHLTTSETATGQPRSMSQITLPADVSCIDPCGGGGGHDLTSEEIVTVYHIL